VADQESDFLEQRQQLIDAAKEVLGGEAGEIVLEQLKRNYGFYSPNFAVDPYETAYREGQRSVVLYLMKIISDEPIKQIEGD